MISPDEQRKLMIELAWAKMPFGKYSGRFLSDIPEAYYSWFAQKGFPPGKLGQQMAQMNEIKINGQEKIFREIRSMSK